MKSAIYWGSVLHACSAHSAYTRFFLNVRMLVFRARLNVLIFLPILACNILVLFLNYN